MRVRVALGALVAASCVIDAADMAGRPCPCVAGYTCIDGRCVLDSQVIADAAPPGPLFLELVGAKPLVHRHSTFSIRVRLREASSEPTSVSLVSAPPGIIGAPGVIAAGATEGEIRIDCDVATALGAAMLRIEATSGASVGTLEVEAEILHQHGAPDTDFGAQGLARFAHQVDSGIPFVLQGLSVGPDESLIVSLAGRFFNATSVLWRLSSDGKTDTTFASGGYRDIDVPGTLDTALLGKEVTSGTTTFVAYSSGRNTLLRVLADGGIDPSFGLVQTPPLSQAPFSPGAATVETSGAPLVVSNHYVGSTDDAEWVMWRYATDGGLDRSYGDAGVAVHRIVQANSSAPLNACATDAQGRTVVVGTWLNSARILRIDGNGVVDPSFGTQGVVTEPSVTNFLDVAVLPDGRVLATGSISSTETAVLRYRSDGTLDSTFGVAGRASAPTFVDAPGNRLALSSDGGVLVWGRNAAVATEGQIVRLSPDGQIDAAFGDQGKVTVADFSTNSGGAIAVQGEKIVVATSTGVRRFWP